MVYITSHINYKSPIPFYAILLIKPYKNNIYITIQYKTWLFLTSLGKLKVKKPQKPIALIFEKMFAKIIFYLKKWCAIQILIKSNSKWFYKNSIILVLIKNLKYYGINIIAFFIKKLLLLTGVVLNSK